MSSAYVEDGIAIGGPLCFQLYRRSSSMSMLNPEVPPHPLLETLFWETGKLAHKLASKLKGLAKPSMFSGVLSPEVFGQVPEEMVQKTTGRAPGPF